MDKPATDIAANLGIMNAIMTRLRALFGRAKLTPDQAETLATIKFPCC